MKQQDDDMSSDVFKRAHHDESIQTRYHESEEQSKSSVVRIIRDAQSCVIRGAIFHFIHILEGKWSGEVQTLYQTASKAGEMHLGRSSHEAISTKVTYRDGGYWVLRETTAGEDGAAVVQYLKLEPVKSGVVSVCVLQGPSTVGKTTQYPRMKRLGSVLSLTETSHGLELIQRQSATGQLIFFQLIVLSDDGQLVCTTNTYGDCGNLECIIVSRQRRIC